MAWVVGSGSKKVAPAKKIVNPLVPPSVFQGVTPKTPLDQYIETLKKPGTGVGKPVNKNLYVPGTPAPKPKAKPGVTAGKAAGTAAGKALAPKPAVVYRGTAAPAPQGSGGGGGAVSGGGSGGAPAPAGPSTEQKALEKKISEADQLKKYMETASGAVQAELMPALNELNRQIQEMQARGSKATTETTERGARTESDLTQLFKRLDQFTTGVQQNSTRNYEGLKTRMGSTYDQLVEALGNTYDGAQATAAAEANRLGIGNITGVGEANAGMERDQQFLQGLAGTDRAAQVSALGNSQNSFDQLMSMARANAATEGTVRVGQAKRDTNKTLDEIAFELEQGVRGLEGKRGDIEAGRGEMIRQMVEAMQERDYNRNVEQDQMQFERELAKAKFDLDKAAFEMQSSPQPPSQEEILRLANLQADLDKKLYALDNPGQAAGQKLTGDAAGRAVMQQSLSDPKAQTDMWNIIRTLQNGAYDDYPNDPAKNAGKFSLDDPLTLQHLREAIGRRFPNNQQESLDVAREIIRAILG